LLNELFDYENSEFILDKQRNIKIKSYIVIIFYKSVHFSLGPYEDYDICLTIKEVIITQLKKKIFIWN
jgi:hypothetical protein